MRYLVHLCITCSILWLTGCFPVDIAVVPVDRGGTVESTLDIKTNYESRIYYDLRSGAAVMQMPISAWHIGFSGYPDNPYIELNASLIQYADAAPHNDFDALRYSKKVKADTLLKRKRYDNENGILDSLAIPTVFKSSGDVNDTVYFVFLGYDANGKDLGIAKLQLLKVTPEKYTVRCGMISDSTSRTIDVPRDSRYHHVGLNILTGEIVYHEPPASRWDVVLSRYTARLYDGSDDLYYSVVGLLSAPGVRASKTTGLVFDAMTSRDTVLFPLQQGRAAIGYEWKILQSTSSAVYTIDTNIRYLVRDRIGAIYGLRFISFMPKGNTVFQHRALP